MLRAASILVFGDNDQATLRDRMHLATCMITAVVFLAASIQNFSLGLDAALVALTGASAAVLLLLYASARLRRGRARPAETGLALVLIFFNAVVGFFGNGGSEGGVQYFWLPAVSISVFLLRTRGTRLGLLLVYAAAAWGCLYVEHRLPSVVVGYPSAGARALDIAYSFPVAMVVSAAILLSVTRSYDHRSEALAAAHQRGDDLLRALLPARAADHLTQASPLQTGPASPQRFVEERAEATLLFADMVGFSGRAQAASSEAVVHDLDRIFRRLDELALANGMEKIKTIGDAYMAAAGLVGETGPRAAEAAAATALAFLAATEELTFLGEPVRFRLGLATGPVTAGVIGTQRPHYDVWGDTVNLAARLESHGEAGRVRICPRTAAHLQRTHLLEVGPDLVLAERPRTPTHWLVSLRKQPAQAGAPSSATTE